MEICIELEMMICPSCHVLFWITKKHKEKLIDSKDTHFCPNGHSALFVGKTDKQKYEEEKERAERYYSFLRESNQEKIELKKQISSYKRQITIYKKKKEGKKILNIKPKVEQ